MGSKARILGIDLGRSTGYCILEVGTNKVLDVGARKLQGKNNTDYIYDMYLWLRTLAHGMRAIAWEAPPFVLYGKDKKINPKTHAQLQRYDAVCRLVAKEWNLPYKDVNVMTAKKHCTGSGKADKPGVRGGVLKALDHEFLTPKGKPMLYDATDAACIALYLSSHLKEVIGIE